MYVCMHGRAPLDGTTGANMFFLRSLNVSRGLVENFRWRGLAETPAHPASFCLAFGDAKSHRQGAHCPEVKIAHLVKYYYVVAS